MPNCRKRRLFLKARRDGLEKCRELRDDFRKVLRRCIGWKFSHKCLPLLDFVIAVSKLR